MLLHRLGFRIRSVLQRIRQVFSPTMLLYRILGMRIGSNTAMAVPDVSWPHQVSIGSGCILEKGISLKFDGIWKPGPSIVIGNHVFLGRDTEFNIRAGITVGSNSLIAGGCRFIDHDHGTSTHRLIRSQAGPESPIIIGEDVWLGADVIVLKGVVIHRGSVIAAGSVVTSDVPPGEIWAGIPARKISERSP